MKYKQLCWQDKVFNFSIYFLVIVFSILILYPLIYIVSASLSDASDVISGRVWLWPVNPTLISYSYIFGNSKLMTGFFNSVIYTITGTATCMAITILAAYPLSRINLAGRSLIMKLIVFTMLFSGGLIPTYILISKLNLMNSYAVIPLLYAFQPFNIIIATAYIRHNIPESLFEAARIDGCNDFKMLWKIVIPLSGPILAVVALYQGVFIWNSYFDPMLYLTSESKFPLMLVLRDILITGNFAGAMGGDPRQLEVLAKISALVKYAIIVTASAPLLILYPFLQKYFIKGIIVGSVKG